MGEIIAGDLYSFDWAVLKGSDIFNSNPINKKFLREIGHKVKDFAALIGHRNDEFRWKYQKKMPPTL